MSSGKWILRQAVSSGTRWDQALQRRCRPSPYPGRLAWRFYQRQVPGGATGQVGLSSPDLSALFWFATAFSAAARGDSTTESRGLGFLEWELSPFSSGSSLDVLFGIARGWHAPCHAFGFPFVVCCCPSLPLARCRPSSTCGMVAHAKASGPRGPISRASARASVGRVRG